MKNELNGETVLSLVSRSLGYFVLGFIPESGVNFASVRQNWPKSSVFGEVVCSSGWKTACLSSAVQRFECVHTLEDVISPALDRHRVGQAQCRTVLRARELRRQPE